MSGIYAGRKAALCKCYRIQGMSWINFVFPALLLSQYSMNRAVIESPRRLSHTAFFYQIYFHEFFSGFFNNRKLFYSSFGAKYVFHPIIMVLCIYKVPIFRELNLFKGILPVI